MRDQEQEELAQEIDVLWLKKRTIVRAFEVEHTTAVYSGILRMADLLALQLLRKKFAQLCLHRADYQIPPPGHLPDFRQVLGGPQAILRLSRA